MMEKHVEAGKILKTVREEAVKLIQPGTRMIEVTEFVENRIRELGAEPAFPCNISLNEDAAHCTPSKSDERVFKDGDLVKLDIGAHIDGYIADTAITIDLGDHEELVRCAEEALKNAIEIVEPGITTAEIGEAIENTARDFGFKPVYNLTGHGFMPYVAHAPPSIYNYKTERGVKLEEGMIFAIEPFMTPGKGRVVERGEVEIYSVISSRPVRMKMARELLSEVEKYRTLPFAKRWLSNPREIIISKLVREGILRAYPVLSEVSKEPVSQAEHTVIVTETGAEIIT
ncbi:type II methionyl aminopeptidase [Geoglobus acetivorans]|uniref:Methionine aminopeptidase n=1 Tax=Geoglobus acetivorans TaxID=565033 RepID=A0ABZ3H683_GEOAI|nr:type II methionyl aminopeptidase [Geoglobus acetivorans]